MKQQSTTLLSADKKVRTLGGSATGGWLGRFWNDQSGAMSYVAVAGAMVMMVFGGIGVDMIQAELKRNKIQNTLDRAVLAAAAIENEMDATTTVQEYFNAMGLADTLGTVTVSGGATNKTVSANAAATMPSQFMQLVGVDTLQAVGDATAAQAITQVEISLVLDTSGSMGGTKLEQLKVAAKNFVDTVLTTEGVTSPVSVSLVPYHATVSLGDNMPGYFNLQDIHDRSHCAIFDDASFASTAITPTEELAQLGHFDLSSYSTEVGSANLPWCSRGNNAAIVPVSSDAEELKTVIDTFIAYGNTAIDLGVKWGAALLDPAARPAIAAMANDGLIAYENAARPANFNTEDTLKYIVLMTDGANTTQYDLRPEFKNAPPTGIYGTDMGTPLNLSDDKFSVPVIDPATGETVYYWTRFANNAMQRYQTEIDFIDHPQYPAREYTWHDIYDYVGVSAVQGLLFDTPIFDGYQVTHNLGGISAPYEAIVNGAMADSRLSTVCADAKNNGIVIFTVAVEAPEAGQIALQDCASSASHYYDIDGNSLDDTFAAIARTFQTLRLTQ